MDSRLPDPWIRTLLIPGYYLWYRTLLIYVYSQSIPAVASPREIRDAMPSSYQASSPQNKDLTEELPAELKCAIMEYAAVGSTGERGDAFRLSRVN